MISSTKHILVYQDEEAMVYGRPHVHIGFVTKQWRGVKYLDLCYIKHTDFPGANELCLVLKILLDGWTEYADLAATLQRIRRVCQIYHCDTCYEIYAKEN